MTKTPNPSTEIKLLTKPDNWMDYIRNEGLQQFPGKKEWRERLVYTMLTWAVETEALELQIFCTEYKLSKFTLIGWAKKYPFIKAGVQLVKNIIAGRRKVGAITKKYDKDAAYKDMHIYDETWGKDVNEYWQNLKNTEPNREQNITVILPDTDKITQKREL